MVGREAAVGGVHWKGKDERVGVWAGVVLSPTKAFPEPADSGWLKSLSRGGAPSSHKGVVCLEGGKRFLEQGGRWDVAEPRYTWAAMQGLQHQHRNGTQRSP